MSRRAATQAKSQQPAATVHGDLDADRAWCAQMLPLVSRTFAACIGLLPAQLEEAVLVAYLLCRIADTIEDCELLDAAAKAALLQRFAEVVAGGADEVSPALAVAFPTPRNDDERLAAACDRTLHVLSSLPSATQAAIAPWVGEMCRGMAGFAQRYHSASPDRLQSLESVAELERYCYFVAGTVGHLLTDLFRLHHPRINPARYARLKGLATSFGLGLQLTNIIKDVADDRCRGWCWVPRQLCAQHGTSPETLLDPGDAPAARRVMAAMIALASRHLDDALEYCLALPRSQYRTRLFCLTPLYFAVRTLGLAAREPRLLDPDHKVKISRREVHRSIRSTFLVAPSDVMVRGYYRRLRRAGSPPTPPRP